MSDELPEWTRELRSALDEKLGLVLEAVSADGARCRVPVAGNTQPFGQWHGGASGVVAETLASVASNAHARTLGRIAVGTELNVTHHCAATTGWLHGTATALKLGRQLASYAVDITDDEGRRIASGRVSCFLKDAPQG